VIMHSMRRASIACIGIFFWQIVISQTNRIEYNNQQLFLSGANLAWVSFASDIGKGKTDTAAFADIMLTVHDHGGNAVRWWLHTDGTTSPAFDSSGYVTGPGVYTISDMKKVLDIAWQREIGVKLCLWSFDMLRTSNSSAVLSRNKLLLTDTNYTRAYINKCLIPMVDSLKGNPAIVAWEIFNEPEGMSNEFGFSTTQHISMSNIQRFINLCAGAIHRANPSAQVTSGSWSFKALTDVGTGPVAPGNQNGSSPSQLSSAEKESITKQFNEKYRAELTSDEVMSYLGTLSTLSNKNYYSDSQLIAAGGDLDGTLNFYSVHYYSTIDPTNPTSLSPFHHAASYWGLDKPIVVGEFAMESGQGNPPGIPTASLYDTLYQLGYAGALAWSWSDPTFSSIADMLAGIQSMWDNHRDDVDVHGIGIDWPSITITSPLNNAVLPDTSQLIITAAVLDTLSIDSVEFFASDTLKIGGATIPSTTSSDTSFYSFTWKNIPPGIYGITATATNSGGHRQTSNKVQVTIGTPPMVRLEAENALRQGPGMTIGNDLTASNGKYVDVGTNNDTTSRITWTLNSVPSAGNYPITFGVKLKYDSPKTQFININGVPADTVVFQGPTTSWVQTSINVDLAQGANTIQMAMSWGWMYVDYLAVPSGFVTTFVHSVSPAPASYFLSQNYPNPFNPATTIQFSLAKPSNVTLIVYNVLGQRVASLANGFMNAGLHSVLFDASALSSGVYYYRLEAGPFTKSAKMMLVK